MKSLLLSLTVVLAIALVRSSKQDASVCQSVKPCYCQLSESSYIDLTPIASKRLSAKKGLIAPTYEIQLCSLFTDKCKNVLGCQKKAINAYDIGTVFNFTSTALVELLNGADGRLAKITLDCGNGSESTLQFEEEKPTLTYNFKLTSPHACIKTDTPTTTAPPATNGTTPTTLPTNVTTETTHPANVTTETTHPTNVTTETTHPTNVTTETTHPTNVTTETTHPTNATTETTHTSNVTTATTHTTAPANATTAETSPSTHPTSAPTATTNPITTVLPSTTHKGGASNITSFNVIFLLITGLIISKIFL